MVEKRGKVEPFSRDVLARSLIGSGISKKEANFIAKKIEANLETGLCYEKDEIVRMTEDYIKDDVSDKAAENFRELIRSRREMTQIIVVASRKGEMPFSKVILARSIRVAGADTETAFETAQEVELRLRSSKTTRITSQKLREIVQETLEEKLGSEFSRNYLLWRRVMNAKKPFLLLIGGATGVGKSTLAIEMASLLEIPYVISTDIIREMMKTFFTKELFPFIYYSSYTVGKEVKTPLAANPILSGFYEQSAAVNVGVKAMIKRAEIENVPMIINGVHLIPGAISSDEFDARIVQIMLHLPDKSVHKNRFKIRQRQTSKREASSYVKHFEQICMIQDYLVESARKEGVPVISSLDIEKTVDASLKHITRRLAGLEGQD